MFIPVANFADQGEIQVITFTFSGQYTWTAPASSQATIEVFGAGGGGGNSDNVGTNGGQGGGGGAYSRSILPIIAGTTYYLEIGRGGTAGQAFSTNPAFDGGQSWFNITNSIPTTSDGVLAIGGRKGANGLQTQTPNFGDNTSGIGTVKYNGGSGGSYNSFGGGGGGSSAGIGQSGTNGTDAAGITLAPGGVAPTGGGNGGDGTALTSDNGRPGFNPGGGGGGSNDRNDSRGGNGADGKVIITFVN